MKSIKPSHEAHDLDVVSPYENIPESRFWKTGVVNENPYSIKDIYKKKFSILPNHKIATAGSCFAQHINRYLNKSGYNVLDLEPPPPGLPGNDYKRFGYKQYSARYGNIYTVRQLLQLAEEASGEWKPSNFIWEKNCRFYDALRPSINLDGFDSPKEVIKHREYHVAQVKKLFESMDVFIFTLGLTEMWEDIESGTIYPTAPGTVAGSFNPKKVRFINSDFTSINKDLNEFVQVVKKLRKGRLFKLILTVSPVPLTATATSSHVLCATNYSKSTLRAIAGFWYRKHFVDYFPSFEIITNLRLHSTAYESNLRSVRSESVDNVMNHFFLEHPELNIGSSKSTQEISSINMTTASDLVCEDALLEAFKS